MEPLLLIWIAFAIITALAAQARGRAFLPWLLLGALFGIFALIAVLVMRHGDPTPSTDFDFQSFPTASNSPPPPDRPGTGHSIGLYRGHNLEQLSNGIFARGRLHTTADAARAYIDAMVDHKT